MENKVQELLQIERQKQQLEICKRRYAINDAEKKKRNSAIAMGVFAVCTMVSYVARDFSPEEISQLLAHEIGAYTSWEDLKQYINDLGPSIVGSLTCFFISTANYFKNRKKAIKNSEELNAIVMRKVK